jgi:hypothetical protein
MLRFGSESRDRTCDNPVNSGALYLLSYLGKLDPAASDVTTSRIVRPGALLPSRHAKGGRKLGVRVGFEPTTTGT